MTTETATIGVSRETFISHAIALGKEHGMYRTQIEIDVGTWTNDFDLEDVDFKEIEQLSETEYSIRGTIDPGYDEKVVDQTRKHPAEYVTHSCPLTVEIYLELEDLGDAEVTILMD